MKTILISLLALLGFSPFIAKKCFYHDQCPAQSLTQVLEARHSGNFFDPNKHVTPNQIKSLIHAAQLTPSSYNEQPWNFIICDKSINSEAYDKVFSTLHQFNQNWAKNAQVLAVITASTNYSKNNHTNTSAQYDTGAAALSMAIQATALGLMTHQIAGFDTVELTKLLNLPSDVMPLSVMAIGYEDITRSTTRAKERKPITENFFQDSWGSINNYWQ